MKQEEALSKEEREELQKLKVEKEKEYICPYCKGTGRVSKGKRCRAGWGSKVMAELQGITNREIRKELEERLKEESKKEESGKEKREISISAIINYLTEIAEDKSISPSVRVQAYKEIANIKIKLQDPFQEIQEDVEFIKQEIMKFIKPKRRS